MEALGTHRVIQLSTNPLFPIPPLHCPPSPHSLACAEGETFWITSLLSFCMCEKGCRVAWGGGILCMKPLLPHILVLSPASQPRKCELKLFLPWIGKLRIGNVRSTGTSVMWTKSVSITFPITWKQPILVFYMCRSSFRRHPTIPHWKSVPLLSSNPCTYSRNAGYNRVVERTSEKGTQVCNFYTFIYYIGFPLFH